jgi:HKD family nuclease
MSSVKTASSRFRLVDSEWHKVLDHAVRAEQSFRIICPFIKERPARRFLNQKNSKDFKVITRFNLDDFWSGVSDIAALRLLIKSGAQIRGIRNLHTKLYLFGNSRVILTSANLTEAAFFRNHEFGLVADDLAVGRTCQKYFNRLWERAGSNLTLSRLAEWERTIAKKVSQAGSPPKPSGLRDEGVNLGFPNQQMRPDSKLVSSKQAFVKFFGESHRRLDRSFPVLDEIKRTGCNLACTYPIGKRPRKVRNGAVMFMARMVHDPRDILIYGRAIGKQHEDGIDDASPKDIDRRDWKQNWPHYVRVTEPEFIDGKLSDGVSLNELMETLKSDCFASTKRHMAAGVKNTNPRRAYMQQPHVELSSEGYRWVNKKLNAAFKKKGRVSTTTLQKIY